MSLNVTVDELVEGAERARGTVVIVDVFRATSVMATLFGMGVKEVYPVRSADEARKLKEELEQDGILIGGEFKARTPEDYDFPNSPRQVRDEVGRDKLSGKTIVYSSTNGMRGILAAAPNANEVLTSSFLNYRAVVNYILRKLPETVTAVGMGEALDTPLILPADEDTLHAKVVRDILLGKDPKLEEVRERILRSGSAQYMRKTGEPLIEEEMGICLDLSSPFNVVPKLYQERGRFVLRNALKHDTD